MARMMHAGYQQKYRRDTLSRALRIYYKMVEVDRNGLRPLYRHKDFERVKRQDEKLRKKANWSNKGGCV